MVGRVALPGFDSDASKASRAGRAGASLDATAFVWFNFEQQIVMQVFKMSIVVASGQ